MKSFNVATILTLLTGRLYTPIENFYEILNYLTGQSLMTHHLPVAKNYIVLNHLDIFPKPFDTIGSIWQHSDDWEQLVEKLQKRIGDIELPANVVDQELFGNYMVENSLLIIQSMSKAKSTISKSTTPKNALIKHYNQLAKQLDSLKPEQYVGNYAHNYEHAVMAISKQMLTIIGKISLLVE